MKADYVTTALTIMLMTASAGAAEPTAKVGGAVAPTEQAAQPDEVSVQERYGSWVVSCHRKGAEEERCLVTQTQQEGGVRVLSVELIPDGSGGLGGRLVLPFGFNLGKGLTLSADNVKPSPLAFSTCLPEGCVAPVAWEKKTVGALLKAATWTVSGEAAGGEAKPTTLTVPVAGLEAALARSARGGAGK